MKDVDNMEQFWSTQINSCLDIVAPWKTQKMRQKRFLLPNEVKVAIKKQKELLKRHQENVHNGQIDVELEAKFKKHRNYTNSLIKKSLREKSGENKVSNLKQVWKSINDILKPEDIARKSMKIESENGLIEDPQQLEEEFNVFFKEKVEKLAHGIKKDMHSDPFLKEKINGKQLKFKLRTVKEADVLKVLK